MTQITPRTMLQKTSAGAPFKRRVCDSVNDPHVLLMDLDSLDQGLNDLAPGVPLGFSQPLRDMLSELLELADHQSQLGFVVFFLLPLLGLLLQP
jgi:hypothetical protein